MMTVYIETNFILELAFAQEQVDSCNAILSLCEEGKATMAISAFCIGECFETLVRRSKIRTKLANDLSTELKQLARSVTYQEEVEASESVTALLVRSSEEDERRLDDALRRILAVAQLVPIDAAVIVEAERNRRAPLKLGHQDAIVYASIISHLQSTRPSIGCFLNRNRNDFNNPNIDRALSESHCKLLFSFEKGLDYIRSRVSDPPTS